MKRLVKLVSFAAGLGVVSWLLKDRLVPVPDPSRLEPPPAFKQPPPDAPAPSEPAPAAADAAPDDLTSISGIGPAFATRLADAGISSFAALLAADPDAVADAVQGISAEQVRDWQEQARSLG